MSTSPDSAPRPLKKEEVLSRCPYTSTLLDTSLKTLSLDKWEEELSLHRGTVNDEIKAHIGQDWIYTVAMPTVFMLNRSGVLNKLDDRDAVGRVAGVIEIGFELGSHENYFLFINDLVSLYTETDLFNPKMLGTKKGLKKVVEMFTGVVEVGMNLKAFSRLTRLSGGDSRVGSA